MSLGIIIKYFRSLLARKSILRRLEQLSSDQCLILTYHRVLPKGEVGSRVEPGMYVTPDVLRMHIRFLQRFFQIIPADQLNDTLAANGGQKKPACVLSFDDGWLDFYQYAWPILREEEVPAVVYLPTALIGSKEIFWTDRLARLLEKEGGVKVLAAQFSGMSRDVNLKALSNFHGAIELLKEYSYQDMEKILAASESEVGIDCKIDGRSFMHWDDVHKLYGTGLVFFGSHTVKHAILTNLPVAEIRTELQESRARLLAEKVAVDGNISFCYPNGNYTTEITDMVRDCGYVNAVTCECGWNGSGDNMFTLKRIGLHQDVSFTEALFAWRLHQFL